VEVSSVTCTGAKVVVRVTCRCGRLMDQLPCPSSPSDSPLMADQIAPVSFCSVFLWQSTGVRTEFKTRLIVLSAELCVHSCRNSFALTSCRNVVSWDTFLLICICSFMFLYIIKLAFGAMKQDINGILLFFFTMLYVSFIL